MILFINLFFLTFISIQFLFICHFLGLFVSFATQDKFEKETISVLGKVYVVFSFVYYLFSYLLKIWSHESQTSVRLTVQLRITLNA